MKKPNICVMYKGLIFNKNPNSIYCKRCAKEKIKEHLHKAQKKFIKNNPGYYKNRYETNKVSA